MSTQFTFNEHDVNNALRLVIAPHMSTDIVSAGCARSVAIDGANIALTIACPLPPEPAAAELEQAVRRALADHLPGLGSVDVTIEIDIPGKRPAGGTAVLPQVANTIAVASGKGGVGKSTVAVNLAVALARAGARVGLLDADIYGPSLPLMMNVKEQPLAYREDGRTVMLPIERFGVKLMSIGFLVPAEDALVWRGPMASNAMRQLVSDVEWGELDYMIFDMPPGTGDIQLTLSQMLPLSGAVIVSTPQDIALADARKGVRMFQTVSVPILGVIENMSYYICGHCGAREHIFHHGGGRETALELGVPFLGEIPLLTQVREGGDAGAPVVAADPESAVAASFIDVALSLAGSVAERQLTQPAAPSIDISL
jgi:ATP-binding protein involved in chromosome partitioning